MPGKIYIGTSGWHYKHWLGTFYPSDLRPSAQLQFYTQHFTTVEINNSFYKLPSAATFDDWRNAVPDDFIFAVKASRFTTHMKKLTDPAHSAVLLLENSSALGNKRGPVLFQLPPRWKVNAERLRAFLQAQPSGLRYAFEFRDVSWYHADVLDVLKQYNSAFCIYELGGHRSPSEITADFVYVRLHGPKDRYQGSYSDEDLRSWSRNCRRWARQGKDVYVYFDNDQHGFAAFNALTLQGFIKG